MKLLTLICVFVLLLHRIPWRYSRTCASVLLVAGGCVLLHNLWLIYQAR